MKIGIIVHSQTGNTHSVALKLQEKLTAAGHSVEVEQLKTVGEVKPGAKDISFEALPDIKQYDALVFGAPVQAFSLSAVMKSYLDQVASLQGKKTALLVTQHFPYRWMGGSRAVGQMRMACEAKGAAVCGKGIVNWSRKDREQQVSAVVKMLQELLD